jgi:hypothetical protein
MMVSSRYSITHPLLTPEHFRLTPFSNTSKVRALIIYQDNRSPDVVLETRDTILDDAFASIPYRCVHFESGFHFYISALQGYQIIGENLLATRLMRLHYLMDIGYPIPDTLYGDVCVFGSGMAYHGMYDNRDYSVPYEVVEQVIHLYDKI